MVMCRASLVPAAAVIPAARVDAIVAAVKTLVVEGCYCEENKMPSIMFCIG